MRSLPVSWLPLVGLLALPFVVAFVVTLEPIAALAAVNTVLIVVAVRLMFGSRDLERLGRGEGRVR
ncbi:hypothetical protein [Haloarcula salina]|uniref:DUF8131 domain-containing protein n=1 Tax=Haloarcula salina TaxID=1429914 RepID=A0AA41KGD4_9EURY|nr:hypothetical protein [Haloarcula salina]MBV0902997.1 hypothetical protein [Haloarcula salina]